MRMYSFLYKHLNIWGSVTIKFLNVEALGQKLSTLKSFNGYYQLSLKKVEPINALINSVYEIEHMLLLMN